MWEVVHGVQGRTKHSNEAHAQATTRRAPDELQVEITLRTQGTRRGRSGWESGLLCASLLFAPILLAGAHIPNGEGAQRLVGAAVGAQRKQMLINQDQKAMAVNSTSVGDLSASASTVRPTSHPTSSRCLPCCFGEVCRVPCCPCRASHPSSHDAPLSTRACLSLLTCLAAPQLPGSTSISFDTRLFMIVVATVFTLWIVFFVYYRRTHVRQTHAATAQPLRVRTYAPPPPPPQQDIANNIYHSAAVFDPASDEGDAQSPAASITPGVVPFDPSPSSPPVPPSQPYYDLASTSLRGRFLGESQHVGGSPLWSRDALPERTPYSVGRFFAAEASPGGGGTPVLARRGAGEAGGAPTSARRRLLCGGGGGGEGAQDVGG